MDMTAASGTTGVPGSSTITWAGYFVLSVSVHMPQPLVEFTGPIWARASRMERLV